MRLTVIPIHVFVAWLLCFCGPAPVAVGSEIDAAIDRGLAWIKENPASCRDGGFLDMVDEGLFYRTVKRLMAGTESHAGVERAYGDCMNRLAASPEFGQWLGKSGKTLIEHYHLLLAAHLLASAQIPMPRLDALIQEAQRALARSRFEHPTFRLTVAVLLQHLGAEPRVSMKELMNAGLVNRVTQRNASAAHRQPRMLRPLAYYALIHEIAAMTEFGRLPAPPWLMARREALAEILQEGMRRARHSAHIDLLAEMLLCAHMLGLSMTADVRAGVDFLLANQREDGTWGEQATPRSNRTRHAVLTATAALLAFKTDNRDGIH